MTVPSMSGKLRKVKNRSSTAPISAAGRSGRSFIVASAGCKRPLCHAGIARSRSVERLFRHRKPAEPIFRHRYGRSGFQLGRKHPFWAMAKPKSASPNRAEISGRWWPRRAAHRSSGAFSMRLSVVSAAGQAPKAAFVEGARTTLTTPGSTQSPSMFRDLLQGSPIEADQIIGDLLARGAKAGIPTPLLAAAYANMSVYQDRLAQS